MAYNFLIVDDTNFMRKMAADCLKQYGHVVAGEATNGKEAIKQYEELQPDIVMMDLTMPEMNGLDAIKEILKIDPTAVILICSASNQQEMIVEALDIGAKGYLMKPFKPDRLNEIISKYAEPHLVSKKEDEKKLEREASWSQNLSKEVNEIIRKYDDDTTSIYGSEEFEEKYEKEVAEETAISEAYQLEEEEIEVENDEVVEPITLSEVVSVVNEVEEEKVLDVEDPMLVSQDEDDIDEAEQAVEYAEELLAVIGSEKEVDTESEPEVVLELDDEEEEEEPQRQVVELASESVSQKTYKFPVSRNKINFVTSYKCNWQEEDNEDVNQYAFVCSEEDNKVSIEMTNGDNEMQKVELSLDGFRQLFTWMEDRFEEGRKHKVVGSK
jgi:DNA-binding NarL/FixJ family response regulator